MTSVCVVVPSVGRREGLQRLAAALCQQEAPSVPWDVVVVDNTPAGVVTAGDLHGLEAIVVHEPQPGASAARNRGIAATSAPIIAFVDDDVVPDRAWLRRLVSPLLEDPDLDGTGGPVVLDRTAPRPRWLAGDTIEAYYSSFDRQGARHELPNDGYVLTANAAFRREALTRVSGFDPALGPRPRAQLTNDDVDVCRKVLRTGGRILWVPEAVVVHDLPAARTTLRYLLRRAYAQGRSDWLLDATTLAGDRPAAVREHVLASLHHTLDLARHHPRTAETAARLATTVMRAAGFTRQAVGSSR